MKCMEKKGFFFLISWKEGADVKESYSKKKKKNLSGKVSKYRINAINICTACVHGNNRQLIASTERYK